LVIYIYESYVEGHNGNPTGRDPLKQTIAGRSA